MRRWIWSIALLTAFPLVGTSASLSELLERLKEAESKKDAALVKQLAAETSALARQIMASPEPQIEAEKEAWKERVEYAKSVDLYTEYALVAVALQSPPDVLIDLVSTLEQQNPKSQYLERAYLAYLAAIQKRDGEAKAVAVAEKAIEHHPQNEDLLSVLMEAAVSKKQTDRALNYANRLISVLSSKQKPEHLTPADWERKRGTLLGRGYFIAGIIQAERNQYAAADKYLRAALPYIKGNDAMMGPALFQLGVVNYQLARITLNRARMLEAAKFSEQAAAIKGEHAYQAWRNAQVMRDEAARMK